MQKSERVNNVKRRDEDENDLNRNDSNDVFSDEKRECLRSESEEIEERIVFEREIVVLRKENDEDEKNKKKKDDKESIE